MPLYPTDYLCDFCKKNLAAHSDTTLFCSKSEDIIPEESYFVKEDHRGRVTWNNSAGIVYKIPIGIGCEYFEADQEKYDNDPRTKEGQ